MLFNIIYWIFAFLRMGTSGLTSQSLGRGDSDNIIRMLARSIAIAFAIAVTLLVLQVPLREIGLLIMQPTEEVRQLTVTYYNICIWGAPATLGLFALTGWFIGMQNSKIPMMIAITQNVVNILVSLVLVFGLGMRVEGVASGTLIAQWCGFLMGCFLCWRNYFGKNPIAKDIQPLRYYLSPSPNTQHPTSNTHQPSPINLVMMFFTSAGSWQGEVVLAVNTLLMQLYLLVSYIMDGFANAGEALSGKFYGAGDNDALRTTVRRIFFWGMITAVAFTVTYIAGGKHFLRLLTDEPSVVEASTSYVWWAYLVPFCSVAAFMWDGIFIGLTASRQMLLSMFVAAATFFIVYFIAAKPLGNHGLWFAFMCYMFIRGVIQTFLYPSIIKKRGVNP